LDLNKIDKSSRNVLNRFTAKHITGETLFARLGRAVCDAECLSRKEFFEAWEVARRLRRKMRGGPILELAAGHGLLCAILILLDDSTPNATCIDIAKPLSQKRLLDAMESHWPRLKGRIEYVEKPIEQARASSETLAVSVHACGRLTDQVLDLALEANCRVAVLPCCHDLRKCDTGSLSGWMDGPLAVDATRVARLLAHGYRVSTLKIPKEVTPKNRLLLGWPNQNGV
jgi:Methyltransferase domain